MTPNHLAATAALSLLGLVPVPAAASDSILTAADAYITQGGSGQSWTIGNAGIAFQIGLNDTGVLVPLGLGRPAAGVSWEVEPAPGPVFQQGGRRLSPGGAAFPLRAARVEEYGGGVRLSLVFDDPTTGLRLTRSYVCYPQAPAIETWSTFEVIGAAGGIAISDIGIWQLTVPAREVHWVTGLGAGAGEASRFARRRDVLTRKDPFQIVSTGRSSEVAVPTFSFSGPAGRLFAGLLWSGAWTLSVTGPSGRGMAGLRLSAGSTTTTVRQGEPFETPHCVFGVAGDRDLDVTAALQQYVTNGVRRGRPIGPLVTYNTWFAHGTAIDDASVRAEMRSAAGLGVELFVLDAGWSPGAKSASDYTTGLGSWTVDARRFPGGLGSLGDYARSLGMKFGVWVEPERVDTTTLNRAGLARERFLATVGGRYNVGVKNEHADAAQICLGDSQARQWVLDQLVGFIDTVRPDYLKWDNNYWINCNRSGHGHGTADGNFAHVRGLYILLAELRARYPNLIIENCSGGGNRLDLGMLQYTDVGWMDDVSGPSVHVRHNLQGLGPLFPSRYLLSFVMDDATEPIHAAADMPLYFRSRMAGALGLSLVGAEFGPDDLARMSREIALYKRLRDIVPDPVLALLTDQARETSTASWDAVQLSSPATGGHFMLAFQGGDADRRAPIRPLDLSSTTVYRVSTGWGRALERIDGATLMEFGVEVGGGPATAGHVVVLMPDAR